MEKGFSFRKKNVPPTQKEVFKDLNAEIKGRDSPESGSLYSDYESGQQYEDKVNCWISHCVIREVLVKLLTGKVYC